MFKHIILFLLALCIPLNNSNADRLVPLVDQQISFINDATFGSYAYYFSKSLGPKKFQKNFGRDLRPSDTKRLKYLLRNVKQMPKMKYQPVGQYSFETATAKIDFKVIDSVRGLFSINGHPWTFRPNETYEKQLDSVLLVLNKTIGKKSALFDYIFPQAHSLGPLAPLYPIGLAIIHAARFSWPYIKPVLSWGVKRADSIVNKTLEVSASALMGGFTMGTVVYSRMENIPLSQAAFCIFNGLQGKECKQEKVKAELGETSERLDEITYILKSCPSKERKEFSILVNDVKKKKSILRVMKFEESGVIREMQEYHAYEFATFQNLGKVFQVKSPESLSYIFDKDGKLEQLKSIKFTVDEMLLENPDGTLPKNQRPSLIINPTLSPETILENVTKRDQWLDSIRDKEKDKVLLNRPLLTNQEEKSQFDAYSEVVRYTDRLQKVMCAPLPKPVTIESGAGANESTTATK